MAESIIKSSRINPLYMDTVAKFDLKQPNGFYLSYEAVFTPESRKYIKLGDGERTDDQVVTDENQLKILEENVAPKIVEQAHYPLWYRAFKGIKNIITKKEFGGTMNYALYLQDGGQTPMSDEQALELQKQKDAELAEAIKQNPESLPKMIEEYGEDAPSFVKHIVDIAIENRDEDLAKLIAPFAELLNIFKCGGKVRAKVKKACGGKRLEKGAKVPEVKKGECPCQYKKVGGRIIEVNCNGIPVAKNGAVMKFETPAGTLPTVTFGKNKNGVNTYTVDGRTYTGYSGTFSDLNGTAPTNYMNLLRDAEKWANSTNGSAYKQMAGNVYSKFGTDRLYGKVAKDGKTYYYSNLGASDAKWNSDTNLWEREGYTYTPYKMQNGQNSFKWVQNEPSELQEVEVTTSAPAKTPGQLMFERRLAPNTLSDYSLRGRQNWVNSAENQAYLEANGWDAAKRAAYKGSAADNRELLRLIQGRAGWQPALPSYTPTLPANLTEGQRTAVQAFDQKHNRYEGQMSDAAQYVRNAYAGAENGALSNDALAQMTGAQAAYLTNNDFKRYMNMQADLGADKAAKAQALTLNGIQYASPEEYNALVNKINSGRWDQALIAAGAQGGASDPNKTALQLNIASNLLSGNRDLTTRAGRRDLSKYMKEQGYGWKARQAAKKATKNLNGLDLEAEVYQEPTLAYSNDKNYLYRKGGKIISYGDYLK